MNVLSNKVAVVTGAGRGIGKAISIALAKNGCDVTLCARSRLELDSVAIEIEGLGRRALAVRTDVTKESDVQALISSTMSEFGRIDILINNAGIGRFSNVAELLTDDFDAMWAVNMRGVFLCTRNVIPQMIKQGEGDIVNLSSLAGRNAFIGGAGYCATKWALIGFARCLMLEVRDRNIGIVTVCPALSIQHLLMVNVKRKIHHLSRKPKTLHKSS